MPHPGARRRGTRSAARLVGGALLVAVAVTLATSFTAGNTVPATRAGVTTQPIAPGQFPPTSTITFPATGSPYTSSTWAAGCTSAVCGMAHDSAGGVNILNVKISILGPSARYWNGIDFNTATSEQKLGAAGTATWSFPFPISGFATAGGGDGTYTVKSYATDSSGNTQAPATTVTFSIDTAAPANSLALTAQSPAGSSFKTANSIYYRGTGSGSGGSFKLRNPVSDGGSGPASSSTAPLGGTATGWTHTPSTVNSPTGGPYDSNAFTWSEATASQPTEVVTGADTAGNTTAASALTFINDATAPAGGALTVGGVVASAGGTSAFTGSGSFAIGLRTDFSDGGSGLASSTLSRQSAVLSSAGGVVAGSCGSFGAATVLVGSPAQVLTGPACYLFTLAGVDNVGNVASVSTTVLVDTSAPSVPVLAVSAATGGTFVSGSTVYVNAQVGRSGGFTVAATSSDSDSGVQKLAFPALAGFASGGGVDLVSPFSTVYAWSGAVAATGVQTVTATNNAGLGASAGFTVTPDTAAPTGGALTVNGAAASAGGTSSSASSTGFSIGLRTDYTDAGSGLSSSTLTIQSATLAGVTCGAPGSGGAYTSATAVSGTINPTIAAGFCYAYTLAGTDKVGNAAVVATTVQVIATPTLNGLSAANTCPTAGCGWAVGDRGTILYSASAASFQGEASRTAANLNGIAAPVDDGHVWAVGDGGTILECTVSCQTPASAVWAPQTSNTTANLYAVAGATNSLVWAVGAGGVIDFWNGSTWTVQQSGKAYDLLSIGGSTTGTGWAVGTGGTILVTTNGNTWTSQTAPLISGSRTYDLSSVGSNSASQAWAVGAGGAIISTTNTGATWVQDTSPTANALYGVVATGTSPSTTTPIYAVGAGGVIMSSTNGTTFAAQTSPTTNSLFATASWSGSTLWAVGQNESILYTSTKGATWTAATTPFAGLSPANGSSGQTIAVTGSGFAATSALSAKFNGATVALSGTTTTSATGTITGAAFVVPGSLTSGASYQLVIADAAGDRAVTIFTVN